jgi:hypothetical protein
VDLVRRGRGRRVRYRLSLEVVSVLNAEEPNGKGATKNRDPGEVPPGVDPQEWRDWQKFKRDKKAEKVTPYVWMRDCIGQRVELYMTRAPKAEGVIRKFDTRYGRVLIETDDGMVECSLGAILQVRYAKP